MLWTGGVRSRERPDSTSSVGTLNPEANRMEAWQLVSTFGSTRTDPDFYNYPSLTTKLPFEDDEFDHVHVSMIAKGVPENKVSGS